MKKHPTVCPRTHAQPVSRLRCLRKTAVLQCRGATKSSISAPRSFVQVVVGLWCFGTQNYIHFLLIIYVILFHQGISRKTNPKLGL